MEVSVPSDKPEDPESAESSGQPSALFRSLVGHSEAIQEVRRLIERIAHHDSNVLILGETGTGKEVVARNIHFLSKRCDALFSALNCAAVPQELLESELFGHEQGAFTGAITTRKGRFELAHGGTVLLDEIGDMRPDMQVKLLRVLQEKRFCRVGGVVDIECDVRVLSATHQDLEAKVADGTFREDLYYRLNVVPVRMPPLRDRTEDIPLLITELNARLAARGFPAKRVGDDAFDAMIAYDWPGNVRELANVMERCANLVVGDEIRLDDLPDRIRRARGTTVNLPGNDLKELVEASFRGVTFERIELRSLLEFMEGCLISQALDKTGGVVSQAADRLGLRRSTLVDKIQKLGIDKQSEDSSEI